MNIMQGKTQADLDLEAKQTEIDSIKVQLKELDKTIPRIIEDMITAGVYTPNTYQKEFITQKEQLRARLGELNG